MFSYQFISILTIHHTIQNGGSGKGTSYFSGGDFVAAESIAQIRPQSNRGFGRHDGLRWSNCGYDVSVLGYPRNCTRDKKDTFLGSKIRNRPLKQN